MVTRGRGRGDKRKSLTMIWETVDAYIRYIHILISFTVHYCSYVNKDYLKDGEPILFPVFSLKRDLRKPVFLLPSDKEN